MGEPNVVPELVFLGYAPVKPHDGWPPDWPFDWVASVDGLRPDDWIHSWNWNLANCWNTEQAAWAVVEPGQESRYRMCAYWLAPVFHRQGDAPEPRKLKRIFDLVSEIPLPEAASLEGFERLGFDVVGTRLIDAGPCAGFHTSPLSTSLMWPETTVNRYCLMDEFETAAEFAARCNRELPEPEEFFAIEVWAKR